MSDLFEINGIKDEEVDYYISLGYSRVMAEQIAAFDFPPMPLNLTETAESRDTSGFAPRSSGYVHDYTYFRTDDSDTEYSTAVGVEDDDPETVIASGEYIFWGDKKYNTQQGYLTMCREQNIGYLPFHLTYSEKSPHFCVATEYKREGDKAYLLLGINESDFFRPAKNQNLVLLVDSANLNYNTALLSRKSGCPAHFSPRRERIPNRSVPRTTTRRPSGSSPSSKKRCAPSGTRSTCSTRRTSSQASI